MFNLNASWVKLALALLPLVGFQGCLTGCAQNNPAQQSTAARQVTRDENAAQGSSTNVEIAPFTISDNVKSFGSGRRFASSQPTNGGSGGDLVDAGFDEASGHMGSLGSGSLFTYNHFHQTITVQSGGSSTGQQSTGGNSGQSTNPALTKGEKQDNSASVAANLQAAAPGGSNQGNATAAQARASEQGTASATSTLTPQQSAELRTLQGLKDNGAATPAQLQRLQSYLDFLSGKSTTAPVPPTTGSTTGGA